MVDKDWQFPCTNLKDMWNLWHFGHLTEKIRPLCFMRKFNLNGAAQVTRWAKAKRVMKEIAKEMVEMRLVRTEEDVRTLTAAESSEYFDRAVVQFIGAAEARQYAGQRAMDGHGDGHGVCTCAAEQAEA
jgi:hypothetical protein